jgi:GT2 family glycosyltransferase
MSVAIVVPSLNQGRFLGAALDSIVLSHLDLFCAVLDGGSSDESVDVIRAHEASLAFWRSEPDGGQTAAVNDGIARLGASHAEIDAVGWLNADDFYLDHGLEKLSAALVAHPDWVAVAGRGMLASESGSLAGEIATAPFSRHEFARWCTICQPATLIRRSAWETLRGLDLSLGMCFDYDLWWRLSHLGPIGYLDDRVAASRDHGQTKTRRHRQQYFREATVIVRRETGHVPWHWYISEALEREVGYEIGRRPGLTSRLHAAWQAGTGYLFDRDIGVHS